jgi:predicted Zn-dependent protease
MGVCVNVRSSLKFGAVKGGAAKFGLASAALVLLLAAVPGGMPAALAKEPDGVKISNPSIFRYAVSAGTIEQQAGVQYDEMTRQAASKRALLGPDHPQTVRMRAIAQRLLPFANKFNERAKDWKWEVNVLDSPQVNAFCMPGGKIAVFTGILQKLQLTDDEAAMVMGHEIGHALYEHARARAGKSMGLGAVRAVAGLIFGQLGDIVGAAGGSLASLKFSRGDETQADLIGLELAARAGFDPRAGITLWQKMSKASQGAPPQWMSTHPSGETRIKAIKDHIPEVIGLYETAKLQKQ